MKNLEPMTESEIVKGAVEYSNPCRIEKIAPRMMVSPSLFFACW
jgi:hypothetical protein